MGYLCANFSLPIDLSVLDLAPMYATDRRQTSDAHHRLIPPPYGAGAKQRDGIATSAKGGGASSYMSVCQQDNCEGFRRTLTKFSEGAMCD